MRKVDGRVDGVRAGADRCHPLWRRTVSLNHVVYDSKILHLINVMDGISLARLFMCRIAIIYKDVVYRLYKPFYI